MSDKINLKEMEQNAYKLLNRDGLMELLMGVILFVVSSSFGGASGLSSFLALYVIFLKKIVEGFRKRFTYPRIGYLELPEEDSTNIGLGIFKYMGAVMLALVVFVYLLYGRISGDLLYNWIPLLIALIFFGGLQYHYSKSGDRLTLAYTGIILVMGLIFSILDFPGPFTSTQLYTLSLSAIFIVAGVLRFYKFRKDYPIRPIPEEATEHE